MQRTQAIFLLILVSVLIPVSFAFASPPKGAIKLPTKDRFKSGAFYCGRIKSKWIPGRMTSGYFYSHAAERSNILASAKKASGKKKTALKTKAALLKSQIDTRTPVCQNGNVTPTPTPSTNPLRFDFSDATGLALKPATSGLSLRAANNSASSNLNKMRSDGSLSLTVTSGNANVQKFLIAPNNKLYTLFSLPVNLDDTNNSSNGCNLAQIDKDSGIPVCIENQISVNWQYNGSSAINKPVQFDQDGNIYYVGTNGFSRVLRKYSAGQKTDLINDNININDFLVLPDGRIIVSGTTTNSSAQWIRRINPSGGLTNLYTSVNSTFLRTFPDNNIYIGGWGGALWGVGRFLPNSDGIDSRPWIAYEGMNGQTWNPYNDVSSACSAGANAIPGFCGSVGSSVTAFHRTLTSKVYAVAGYGADGTMMKYYPTVERPITLVKKIAQSQGILNSIALAGLNASDKNVMTLFNTDDDSEIELISPSNEIEVYHLNYSASENSIFFDGLRFSDNKYVVGKYDFNTMTLTASSTGSTKLEDLQTFN